jgi:hypothetical protein
MNPGGMRGEVYHKKEHEKDRLLMAGGCWSINLQFCDLSAVAGVVFTTELGTYSISCEDALKHGFERVFRGETKWVVPIRRWVFVSNKTEVEVEVKVPEVPVEKPKEIIKDLFGEIPY